MSKFFFFFFSWFDTALVSTVCVLPSPFFRHGWEAKATKKKQSCYLRCASSAATWINLLDGLLSSCFQRAPVSLLLSRNRHPKKMPKPGCEYPTHNWVSCSQWGLPVAARWPLFVLFFATLVVLGAPVVSRVGEVPLRVANLQLFLASQPSPFFFFSLHKLRTQVSSGSIRQNRTVCVRDSHIRGALMI